jgi:uncharacterized membrane protein
MLRNRAAGLAILALTYQTNIKPILDAHCTECHHPNGKTPDFTAFPFWSPSSASQTEIVSRVLTVTGSAGPSMPPGNRPAISQAEWNAIQSWLNQGLQP